MGDGFAGIDCFLSLFYWLCILTKVEMRMFRWRLCDSFLQRSAKAKGGCRVLVIFGLGRVAKGGMAGINEE